MRSDGAGRQAYDNCDGLNGLGSAKRMLTYRGNERQSARTLTFTFNNHLT